MDRDGYSLDKVLLFCRSVNIAQQRLGYTSLIKLLRDRRKSLVQSEENRFPFLPRNVFDTALLGLTVNNEISINMSIKVLKALLSSQDTIDEYIGCQILKFLGAFSFETYGYQEMPQGSPLKFCRNIDNSSIHKENEKNFSYIGSFCSEGNISLIINLLPRNISKASVQRVDDIFCIICCLLKHSKEAFHMVHKVSNRFSVLLALFKTSDLSISIKYYTALLQSIVQQNTTHVGDNVVSLYYLFLSSVQIEIKGYREIEYFLVCTKYLLYSSSITLETNVIDVLKSVQARSKYRKDTQMLAATLLNSEFEQAVISNNVDFINVDYMRLIKTSFDKKDIEKSKKQISLILSSFASHISRKYDNLEIDGRINFLYSQSQIAEFRFICQCVLEICNYQSSLKIPDVDLLKALTCCMNFMFFDETDELILDLIVTFTKVLGLKHSSVFCAYFQQLVSPRKTTTLIKLRKKKGSIFNRLTLLGKLWCMYPLLGEAIVNEPDYYNYFLVFWQVLERLFSLELICTRDIFLFLIQVFAQDVKESLFSHAKVKEIVYNLLQKIARDIVTDSYVWKVWSKGTWTTLINGLIRSLSSRIESVRCSMLSLVIIVSLSSPSREFHQIQCTVWQEVFSSEMLMLVVGIKPPIEKYFDQNKQNFSIDRGLATSIVRFLLKKQETLSDNPCMTYLKSLVATQLKQYFSTKSNLCWSQRLLKEELSHLKNATILNSIF